MYGVPPDLPIEPFVGRELNQICLGRFQIHLNCSGTGSIGVEGHWELRDSTGVLADAARDHADRDSYQLHRIIDVPIVRFSIDPPHSFTLYFDNGLRLTVFDESPQYESFSIQLEGKPTLYV